MSDPATATTPQPMQIRSTAAVAQATGLTAALAVYASDCFEAGHLIKPETALLFMLLAATAPFVHLIARIVMNRLKPLAGEPA